MTDPRRELFTDDQVAALLMAIRESSIRCEETFLVVQPDLSVKKVPAVQVEGVFAYLATKAREIDGRGVIAGFDQCERVEAENEHLLAKVAELERELGRVLMWCDEPARLIGTKCDTYLTGLREAKKQVRELIHTNQDEKST